MSNPLRLLECSKVMIMTSKYEGLPMTVLEAMALGVPLVSTPVDGLKDIIRGWCKRIFRRTTMISCHNDSMKLFLILNCKSDFL